MVHLHGRSLWSSHSAPARALVGGSTWRPLGLGRALQLMLKLWQLLLVLLLLLLLINQVRVVVLEVGVVLGLGGLSVAHVRAHQSFALLGD